MFCEVPAKEFRRLVKKQATHTPRSPNIPALGQLVVRAAGESVSLSVNDLEVACEVEVPARVFVAGRVTCHARRLKKIVAKLPKDGIYRLSGGRDEDSRPALQVEAGNTLFRVPGLEPHEVPEAPSGGEPEGACTVTGRDLKLWKRRIAKVAATDDSRPILNGVLLNYDGPSGTLTVVGTNGHRLVRWRGQADGWGEWQTILPRSFWKHTVRVLDDVAPVTVVATEGATYLDAPGVRFDVKPIEGPFPSTEALFNQSFDGLEIVADAERLSDVTDRLAPVASDQTERLVVTPRRNGGPEGALTLLAEDRPGEASGQARAEARIKGETFRFAVNASYLKDVLYALDAPSVRFKLAGPERGIHATPTQGNGYDALLMPLRLLD